MVSFCRLQSLHLFLSDIKDKTGNFTSMNISTIIMATKVSNIKSTEILMFSKLYIPIPEDPRNRNTSG